MLFSSTMFRISARGYMGEMRESSEERAHPRWARDNGGDTFSQGAYGRQRGTYVCPNDGAARLEHETQRGTHF